jgi:hypothetical protein
MIRETGRVVEGHVEANAPDDALAALSENGIVAESLREDPKPLNLSNRPQTGYSDAIDSALDTSAAQVPFDALEARFKGKQVWVLDRDKIRRRVADVVDQVLSQSMMAMPGDAGGTAETTRAAVSDAINNLFRDNRNLTSRASEANSNLDRQISRLATFISKAEDVLARISAAARGGFGGGGGYAPRRSRVVGGGQEQNKVLKEIFDSNVQLLRILAGEPAASDAEVASAASAPSEPGGEPAMAGSAVGSGESTEDRG